MFVGDPLADDGLKPGRVYALEPQSSLGAFLEAVNARCPRADLVVIADAVRPEPGWAGALQAAATADDTIAAAVAVTGGGQVPGGPARHPRVLVPSPGCVWLRRGALDLIGLPDDAGAGPEISLAALAARAAERGLSCVLADDVVIPCPVPGTATATDEDWARLDERHPWLMAARREERDPPAGPLRGALVARRAVTEGLSVTVDARALAGVGGTQTYTAALVLALAAVPALSVRAVVTTHDTPAATLEAFAGAGVEVVDYERAAAGVPKTDLVHRPQQIFTVHDLRLLRLLGERIVVSQMDLIAYRAPSYHASPEAWRSYRRTTRLALAVADRVLFFSEHGRRDAIAEGLVAPDRAGVAGIGVEPLASSDADAPAAPSDAGQRPAEIPPGRPLLLALGSDYAHKNRPFALRLAAELRRRHGWDGVLVLAGPHVPHGSSTEDERAVLAHEPELADAVIHLGPVSAAQRRWLLANAEAHLTASVYEGFGLAPLEAAAAGRPCLYAACTSLAEIVDPAAATLAPWDPVASADAAIALLTAGRARDQHLALLAEALERFHWPAVIEQVLDGYERALAAPYSGATLAGWDELERERELIELGDRHVALQTRVAYGQRLIDADDPLLTRAEQRGLMRVATRPWLRGPLLAPFGALGGGERNSRADENV